MTTQPDQLDPFDAAIALADYLGQTPLPALTPTIGLDAGETQLAGLPLMVAVYRQADTAPQRTPFFVWGNATIVAASVLAAYSFRQSERQRVAALNRPQWRVVDFGTLHITTHRLAVQGSLAWQDIPYSAIRMVEQHEDGVVLHMAEQSPGKLVVEGPEYLFVLLNFLAFGRIVQPARAQASGPAASWYPDPIEKHQYRYWSGAHWTDHVADGSVTRTDPLPR